MQLDTAHLAILLVCLALFGYGVRLGLHYIREGIPARSAIVCLLISYGLLLLYAGWVAADSWGTAPRPRLVILAAAFGFGIASAISAARSYGR